jgi:hypothetical protein
MRLRSLFVLIGALIGISTAAAVAADPRDSVDRGQRLDTDALRDDMSTNRLQIPSHPLSIQPTQQPAASGKAKRKSGTTSGSSR